ncbi:MAG TPA: hypothetical protein PK239_14745 [Chitinophagales bacterium]|nr:hypothetical protein [Chitinophagales bacterium]HRK28532.1 hypothetical protein [Chitinophagales bacterium]
MEKNTQIPDETTVNTFKKPAPATFTARIDRQSYNRLQTESEERNLPLSTYAASMIKECWALRARAETIKPENRENEVNSFLPDVKQPDSAPAPDVNAAEPVKAAIAAVMKQETHLSSALQKAMAYLRGKFPKYTDEQIMTACILNAAENQAALLFVTDLKHTLKKMLPHEA